MVWDTVHSEISTRAGPINQTAWKSIFIEDISPTTRPIVSKGLHVQKMT